MGGFKDPNVTAIFVEPSQVVEIRADQQRTKYEIVHVNRDSDLLLMQSSLHTLRNQFEELKEYLPLDAVYALEFVILYSSLFEINPKAARRAREEIEKFCEERLGLSNWLERIENLHGGGDIAGLVLPYLEDVHETVPMPNTTIRRECVRYVRWVCTRVSEIKVNQPRSRSLTYQSIALGKRVTVIPLGDKNWSEYGAIAVSSAMHGCNRVILMAWGVFHAEKALQAAVALSNFLSAYSVSRLVVTSRAGRGQVLALYVYVDSGRKHDAEMKFRELWDGAIVMGMSSANNARYELATTGHCLVRNVGGEVRSFLSALFDVMSDSDTRIMECSLWRYGTELRLLLRISRLDSKL
jgi:hypothetical protein